jgi:hypothetical protein
LVVGFTPKRYYPACRACIGSLPQLKSFGRKITSQTDEDGIIEKIFSIIAPRSRTFLEFGIGPIMRTLDIREGLRATAFVKDESSRTTVFVSQ